MSDKASLILNRMLERLYAALVHSPCLNCRVHRSRQRIDLTQLEAFRHLSPPQLLPRLLAPPHRVEVQAKAPPFPDPPPGSELSDEGRAAQKAFLAQADLIERLRDIAEDAREYEQETGENGLYLGFPLISVPPGWDPVHQGTLSARVLAPLALVAVDIAVKRGAVQSVTLTAKADGIDLVVPNYPLLAWLEQQTGKDTSDLFADEDGTQPYLEIHHIAQAVADLLQIEPPPAVTPEFQLVAVPRAEGLPPKPAFIQAAVLGLFPVSNQGLLRDMKALAGGEDRSGPIESFLKAEAVEPQATAPPESPEPIQEQPVPCSPLAGPDHFVSPSDPFQARAVRLAERHPLLVIHGPPGTGKSQTITNIIGDHLARGERILMVCDKRTAIDVVKNRLDHLGLGDLCAVVHDPQRDQKPLYMKIRNQLETLAEQKLDPKALAALNQADAELGELKADLRESFEALNLPARPGEAAFHDLVGEWFSIQQTLDLLPAALEPLDLGTFIKHEPALQEFFARAATASLGSNPWRTALGLSLTEFLSHPSAHFRQHFSSAKAATAAVDASADSSLPPLDPAVDLTAQAEGREQLAAELRWLIENGAGPAAVAWLARPPRTLPALVDQLESLRPQIELAQHPLDAELRSALSSPPPSLPQLNASLAALAEFIEIAGRWFAPLAFAKKNAARGILAPFGLGIEGAPRLRQFLEQVKARSILAAFLEMELGDPSPDLLLSGPALSDKCRHTLDALRVIASVQGSPAAEFLRHPVRTALESNDTAWIQSLLTSAKRARTLAAYVAELRATTLFAPEWLQVFDLTLRQHEPAAPVFNLLDTYWHSLEDILRLRAARQNLPAPLPQVAWQLAEQGVPPDTAVPGMKRVLLGAQIGARIRESAALQRIDAERMEQQFRRCALVEARKRERSTAAIRHRWLDLQQERLLSGTRSQLSAAGAALKRRLFTRGERAMKLRQVIQQGASSAEADPLFDVCPVWMASPATVALIFPRRPIFDVIIFDEASQCRLEEALPVLTRGRRIVIAGDPQQLPPTRFFEAAFVETETDQAESDQELFEQQQAEVEDLLSAALNIQVQQAYLDVHYRSRSEGLIGFSNRNFYQDRLQPLPAHPSRASSASPIQLIRAEGIYDKRGNAREADAVVGIITELLGQKEPPSIGIACFNLVQRDLILDKLDRLAENDPAFAARYEVARNRRGAASFEGLFVKNLENVQGDERDHIVISTTFGPDAGGKFRRNFGPVGRSGGGRRLNVLVTRAREQIHLVTSIPRAEYAVLPELEPGQTPGGRWLLYAYLKYAEDLQRHTGASGASGASNSESPAPESGGLVRVHPTRYPSLLAQTLAQAMADQQGHQADVHCGSDGFCIDLVLRQPAAPDTSSTGVLCDMTRFASVADPVEWELFRTQALAQQGWKLHRVWSPGFFLDPERTLRQLGALQASRPAR